jgi:hypothetical protein
VLGVSEPGGVGDVGGQVADALDLLRADSGQNGPQVTGHRRLQRQQRPGVRLTVRSGLVQRDAGAQHLPSRRQVAVLACRIDSAARTDICVSCSPSLVGSPWKLSRVRRACCRVGSS